MPEADNSVIVRRWLNEVWNGRNDATVRELLDPAAVGHLEGLTTQGIDEFFAARAHLLDAFPDFRVEVEALMADGDHVAARWSASGTHRRPLLGIPATGKPIRFRGLTWFTLSDGRIVEGWDVWNQGRLMAELQAAAGLATQPAD
jgi:steroid delta-isomerase-like uncharacterized protein